MVLTPAPARQGLTFTNDGAFIFTAEPTSFSGATNLLSFAVGGCPQDRQALLDAEEQAT